MLGVQVLGPLVLTSEGEEMAVMRARERALLSMLVIEGGHSLSADRLIDGVWGENLPSNPLAALQTAVSRLRKVVGKSVIVTGAGGYALDAGQVSVDAERFESLIAQARDNDPADVLKLLDEALGLWRGTPYGEFAYEDFAQSEIARLEELRMTAVEGRTESKLALGRHSDVAGEVRSLLSEHPFREALWGQLMLALYRSDRQAEALAAFQEARSILGEELGLEPGPKLRRLEEQILVQDPGLVLEVPAMSFEAPIVPERFRLSTPIASFIGRDQELEAIRERLGTARLVTITGPAGVGKSRLGIEVAKEIESGFEDGVVYMSLDRYEESLDRLFSSFLGSREAGVSLTDQAVSVLRGRRHLLILDGCELFIDDLPALVAAVLGACSGITILATSRQRFGLTGEIVFALEPLETPGPGELDGPAVDLFVDRAIAVGSGFDIDETNKELVARIVRSVDGLPLAVELAATQGVYVPLAELAEKLEERTDMLVSRDPTVPPRHQSLQAAVAASWDGLDLGQHELLLGLSMLHTPFSLDTAREFLIEDATPAEVENHLLDLVDRSLVAAQPASDEKAGSRFSMLRTVREFGRHRLDETGRTAQFVERHARLMASVVDRWQVGARDVFRLREHIESLETQLPDLDIALQWMIDNDPPAALRMTGQLFNFWGVSQRKTEAARWLRAALQANPEEAIERAWGLFHLASMIGPGSFLAPEGVSFAHPFSHWRNRQRFHHDDTTRAEESIELITTARDIFQRGDEKVPPLISIELARSLATTGQLEEAVGELDSVDREVDDLPVDLVCYASQLRARIALAQGAYDEATAYAAHESCLQSEWGLSLLVPDTLGRIDIAQGRFESAIRHYQRLLTKYAEPNQLPGEAIVHLQLSFLAGATRQPDLARAHAGHALELGRRYSIPRVEPMVRFGQAWALFLEGDYDQAERLFEHCYQLSASLKDGYGIGLALVGFGNVQKMRGDWSGALEFFRRIFPESRGLAGSNVVAGSLHHMAECYYQLGRVSDAARLLGASDTIREHIHTPQLLSWSDQTDPHLVLRDALGDDQYETDYAEGKKMSADAAIDLALTDAGNPS